MKECIFCKIIDDEIPSSTIYEDKLIKVIMNINPNTNGHLLIIPKKHYENLLDIDNEIISHSMTIIKEKIYPLLKEKLNCKGLTLIQNNELGQEIKHYHLHLIPRYDNDNVELEYNKKVLNEVGETFDKITN